MKSLITVAAMVVLCSSTAYGIWPHHVPVAVPAPMVVHSFYPVGPVYGYPTPMVSVPRRVVYMPPMVSVPRRVVYMPPMVSVAPVVTYMPQAVAPGHVVYSPGVYAPLPVVIRPKVFVYGQPVRNVVRAVLP